MFERHAKIVLGILLFVIPGFLWGRKLFFAPIAALIEYKDVNSVFISRQLLNLNKSFVTKLFILEFFILIVAEYLYDPLPFLFILVNSFGWLYLVNCYVKLKESASEEVLIQPTTIEPKEPSWLKVLGVLLMLFLASIVFYKVEAALFFS